MINRPNTVAVGTIVWLGSEVMFFAGLFAIYFTLRSTSPELWAFEAERLNFPFSLTNTIILVLSSFTCQFGVFAAERLQPYAHRLEAHAVGHGRVVLPHLRHGRHLRRRPDLGVRDARLRGHRARLRTPTGRPSTSRPASTACTSPAVSSRSSSSSAASSRSRTSATARRPARSSSRTTGTSSTSSGSACSSSSTSSSSRSRSATTACPRTGRTT